MLNLVFLITLLLGYLGFWLGSYFAKINLSFSLSSGVTLLLLYLGYWLCVYYARINLFTNNTVTGIIIFIGYIGFLLGMYYFACNNSSNNNTINGDFSIKKNPYTEGELGGVYLANATFLFFILTTTILVITEL